MGKISSGSVEQPKVFCVAHENTGVSFYRLIQPLYQLAQQKKIRVNSTYWSGDQQLHPIEMTVWDKQGEWADVLYTTAAKTRDQCAYMLAWSDHYKKKLIIDLDDHVTAVNRDHPNYETFMTSNVSLWAQKSIQNADLFITTNTYLALQYASVNANVLVIPNAINIPLWTSLPKNQREKHSKIRIGWSGAAGHERDLVILQHAMEKLRYKYGNKIEFVSIGQQPVIVEVDSHKGFYSVDAYPEGYQRANFDIALAPMADSGYNRSKSNLRLIEASSQKLPIVASPVGEYRNYPCLYAKEGTEWVTQISRLIDDPELRAKVGQDCYNEMEQKYEISVVAPKLLRAIKKLVSEPWKARQISKN